MSSERAGVHTSGALNREAATDVLKDTIGFQPNDAFLDALEACVVPDPRISAAVAYLEDAQRYTETHSGLVTIQYALALLRGRE